jgi:hypothetical protein
MYLNKGRRSPKYLSKLSNSTISAYIDSFITGKYVPFMVSATVRFKNGESYSTGITNFVTIYTNVHRMDRSAVRNRAW